MKGYSLVLNTLLDSNDYLLQVYRFQREYQWGEEESGMLLEDLLEHINGQPGRPVKDREEYSLGLLTLVRDPRHPRNQQIVDGQSRVITICLILLAIQARLHDFAKEQDEEATKQLVTQISRQLWSEGNEMMDQMPQPRVLLKPRDAPFFNSILKDFNLLLVHKPPNDLETITQRNIWTNGQLLIKKLRALDKDSVITLVKVMQQKVQILVASASSYHTAVKVFRTSSGRGKNLEPSDMLKAYILTDSSEIDGDRVQKEWEDQCESEEDQKYFDDALVCISEGALLKRCGKSAEGETYILLYKFGRDQALTGASFWDAFLRPKLKTYFDITTNTTTTWSQHKHKDIALLLMYMRYTMRVQGEWVLVAMLILEQYSNKPADLAKVLKAFDSQVYYMFFISEGKEDRYKRCFRLYKALSARGADNAEQSVMELLLRAASVKTKVLLLRLNVAEQLQLRGDIFQIDPQLDLHKFDEYSIEHILPQTVKPGCQWASDFPDQGFRGEWTNKLGNLALLKGKRNSEAGNKDFKEKKRVYYKCPAVQYFPHTNELLEKESFRPGDLKYRHERLLELAIQIWNLS
ncbi:hypothetical protein CEUSTIGMA_g996.t1 [Chlamydomonas eustigma]|uniref:DUF262 domain-containing protein n=1 Tax=Chlamydomonas eustigma TaxID=1157962 RepID=A0A250WRT6_9CHLO|nr:hypothetical protein CEUSTIGMA_g996.t1 [Chlamydomonas eustigma]|eukprot:GAX73545.1 hypothetical protein CEUSTIGMA_g996.t1 [Chlamydomonas eustigma]